MLITDEIPEYDINPHSRFATTLSHFETAARQVRRGFKVSMAVNVFGVGTVLPNDLPKTTQTCKAK
jgi:hypothetical protein